MILVNAFHLDRENVPHYAPQYINPAHIVRFRHAKVFGVWEVGADPYHRNVGSISLTNTKTSVLTTETAAQLAERFDIVVGN